jgi:hypothetical protein
MAFTKTPDVAQYGGADWSTFVKTVPNSTPESAQRVAMRDPSITFFFYCRGPLVLEGKGTFDAGDAVFFSGKPWYGSAPQCDSYEKDFFDVGYLNPADTAFQNIGCFVLQDGRRFFDIACLFAANVNYDSQSKQAVLFYNEQIADTLNGGAVKVLQDLGVTVLLTVLGNHQPAGWSCFADEASAAAFAQQLAEAVDTYGLDGIDIDDEYSTCDPNDQSLIMVTHALRELEPDIIISKALWSDFDYFASSWNGLTLAEQLSYGWEMSYGPGTPDERLAPYLQYGMQKNQLGLGVWSGQPSDVTSQTQQVQAEGYGGMMIFAINDNEGTSSYANAIAEVFYDESVSLQSGCWS